MSNNSTLTVSNGQAADAATVDDASEALRVYTKCVFEPSDLVEIRPLPDRPMRRDWIAARDLPDQAARLRRLNADGANIYAGANPRARRGGSAADVPLARCLFVDWDTATEAECRVRINAAGLPEPTLFLFSGGGCHAYWRLVDPMLDLPAWREVQKRLIAAVASDPSIHDAPRIMRLPGFYNAKYEPRRLCKIIDADPQRCYELSTIEAALDQLQQAGPLFELNDAKNGSGNDATHSNDGEPVERRSKGPKPGQDVTEGGRNVSLASHVGKLLKRFDATSSEDCKLAFDAARGWNVLNCNPPLDDREVHKTFYSILKAEKESIKRKRAAELDLYVKRPSLEMQAEASPPANAPASHAASDENKIDLGYKLVTVLSEPPSYELFCPKWWPGAVEIASASDVQRPAKIITAVLEQKKTVPEPDFKKLWLKGSSATDGIPLLPLLVSRGHTRRAAPETMRKAVVASRVRDILHVADEVDNVMDLCDRGRPQILERELIFKFDYVWDLVARCEDRIKRTELSALLDRVGAVGYSPRISGRQVKRHKLDPGAWRTLCAIAETGA